MSKPYFTGLSILQLKMFGIKKSLYAYCRVTHQQQWSVMLTRKGLVVPVAWKTPSESMGKDWTGVMVILHRALWFQTYQLPGTQARQLQPPKSFSTANIQVPRMEMKWKWKTGLLFSKTRAPLVHRGAIHQETVCASLSSHLNPYNRAGVRTAVPGLGA